MRVYVLCCWTTSNNLVDLWTKLTDTKVELVASPEGADAVLIVNRAHIPRPESIPADLPIILVNMEPHMHQRATTWPFWGEWAPDDLEGKTVDGWTITRQIRFPKSMNWVEWHLPFTVPELRTIQSLLPKMKTHNIISVVISNKLCEPGHAVRAELVHYLQEHHADHVTVHVYGQENYYGYKNFMGGECIPIYNKTLAILPYKYHLVVENNAIDNYITEKLYDTILLDSHAFYWGAPNASKIYPDAFTQLPVDVPVAVLATIVVELVHRNVWDLGHSARANARQTIFDVNSMGPRLVSILNDIQ